ncbi:MAG: hypothetical protein FWB88_08575 [Defluviitaleaceae bacterium]|nr:hypothetical protein [Defluviitaleaceae bacterium]MCL2240695.1 hypothetical protein [Defluviitaleaceae bacterium]
MIWRSTIKWELRKYFYRVFAIGGGFLLAAWAVLWLLPVPQAHWHPAVDTLVFIVFFAMSVVSVLIGLYMILIHPFTTSFCDLHQATLIEHQSGRPYVYKLSVRVVLNVVTYFMGVGVLLLTMRLLSPFEAWVDRAWFSNMLADSPVVFLPLAGIFALGAPLTLLLGYKYFDIFIAKRTDKVAGLDVVGAMIASGLISFGTLWDSIFIWFPLAAGVTIFVVVNLFLAIFAIWTIARFIDHNAEVQL